MAKLKTVEPTFEEGLRAGARLYQQAVVAALDAWITNLRAGGVPLRPGEVPFADRVIAWKNAKLPDVEGVVAKHEATVKA